MRRSPLAAVCTLALAVGAGHARAAAYTFTTIDVPGLNPFSPPSSGPIGTAIAGINDLGQIAGAARFVVAPPPRAGNIYNAYGDFLYVSGAVTPVALNSVYFSPSSINNLGQIAGSRFVYTNGILTQEAANIPGPIISINNLDVAVGPVGINVGTETQTGFLYTGGSSSVQYLYGANRDVFDGGQIVLLPFSPTSINDAGQIVGAKNTPAAQEFSYPYSSTFSQGILDSGGVITNLDAPGAAPGTTLPTGISNTGKIVGNYTDLMGNSHIFVDDNGNYTSFDVPGAAAPGPYGLGITQATGIDSAGDVVGDYYTIINGQYFEHGFLATPMSTSTAVPEPGSATLLGMGLAALGLTARRRTSA